MAKSIFALFHMEPKWSLIIQKFYRFILAIQMKYAKQRMLELKMSKFEMYVHIISLVARPTKT